MPSVCLGLLMSMSSIRLFYSSTWGMGCGDWVIGSDGDIGVKLVVSLIVVCVLIVSTILFLMLIAISRINTFMFSFISSCTSIIMVVRRSFIIPDTWSFQFSDFSESERVILS